MLQFLLAAALFAADTPPAGVSLSNPAGAAPSASIWRPADSGAFEHLQSGLVCPARFGAYKRTDVMVFDGFGLDVGCNFSTGTAAITDYLTRRNGEGLDAAMAEAKRELLKVGAAKHPQLLSESSYVQDGLSWSLAMYGEDGDKRSGVWITDLHGWTFEFRATYPAADEASVLSDIRVAAAAVQASAGARLDLCAKAPRVERPGALVTDAEKISSNVLMSSLIAGAAESAAEKGKGTPADPVVWCVERPAEKQGRALLFWRAVEADGSDGGRDQASLVRDAGPVVLSLAPDPLLALIEAEKQLKENPKATPAPAQWVATLRRGDQVQIFGYFTDRPPAEAALDLFAVVLAGKTKAAGGYSADGKNITINMPAK